MLDGGGLKDTGVMRKASGKGPEEQRHKVAEYIEYFVMRIEYIVFHNIYGYLVSVGCIDNLQFISSCFIWIPDYDFRGQAFMGQQAHEGRKTSPL